MALDTRNRRASAVAFALPFGRVFPAPDGTIATADRKHIAGSYPGIAASAGAVEIAVSGNGVSITDADAAASPSDLTHFGSVSLSGSTRSHTYVISNSGGATLTIDDVEVPTGFVITAQPASVAAAGTANLTVRLDADVAGSKSGELIIYSDDADEAVFNFAIKGMVYPPCPSPFVYPTFPAPNVVEATITIAATDYDMINGGAYATGTTTPLLSQLYAFHYYWDNYTVNSGALLRASHVVKAELEEDFEGISVIGDLANPSRGWNSLTLQEAANPSALAAISAGNAVLAGGAFDVNRVEPSSLRAYEGTQSLRVVCEAASGPVPITKASLGCGIIHFTAGDTIWAQFHMYIEDGTPLGVIDFESTFCDGSPGVRLLMDASRVPRVQLKYGDQPDVDGTNPVPADAWVKVKMQIGLATSGGVVKVWIDDVLEIDGTMQTLPLNSIVYDRVQFGVTANSEATQVLAYFDDLKVVRSESAINEIAPSFTTGILNPVWGSVRSPIIGV